MPRMCSQSEKGCVNPALKNSEECENHQSTKKDEQREKKEVEKGKDQAKRGLRQQAAKTDTSTVSRVLEGMLEELDNVRGWQREAREQVDALDGQWRFQDKTGGEHLRSEISVYERAMDRTARVLKDMTRLDIDARVAGIEKKQAEFMLTVLMRAMDKAGIQQKEANKVVSLVGQELDTSDEFQQ